MRRKKKSGEKRATSFEIANKLCPELKKEDLIISFPYNLHPSDPRGRIRGNVIIDRESIRVFADGILTMSIQICDVAELKVEGGVGSCFVSYTLKEDGSEHLLCRSDMSLNKRAISASKKFNRIVKSCGFADYDANNEKSKKGKEDEGSRMCPKCGRPMRRGVCIHCTNKLKTIKRLWLIIKPYKAFIILSVVFFVVVSALNLILPELNRYATDEYINSSSPEKVSAVDYLVVILLMLGVQVILRLFSMFRSHLLINASTGVIVDLRNMLFEKIQKLSISKISKRTAGELMRRVSHDVAQIQSFLVHYLPSLIEQAVLIVAIGIVFLASDAGILFLLILIPVPIVVIGFSLFWKKAHKLFRRCWQLGSKSNSVLHDIFSGIRVVKSFGMEHKETERYDVAASEERDMQIKSDTLWYSLMPVMQFLMCFGEFIILFYVGNGILDGGMTLGEMSKYSMYASMIYGPLRMLSNLPRQILNFITSTAKVFEIIDEEVEIADKEGAVNPIIKGDIDINNISFGYDSGTEVLSNVDIHIRSGEFIGLVGKSGVGKSTLINLIMRMYDVEDGNICIDGVDIRDISQESLRSQMGVVLQETFLFAGTVYQNIAYAKPESTREEIIAVSKLAGCHDFIIKLTDGYDTKVGEKGYTLSGGERQRIAIARALLRDPKILILDEATASLDTETEKQIQDALANLSKNRTTIAIAHRLSTLRNATRLVVLDKGRVAEVGSHDELMEKQGIYYGLVMAQREMSKME